MMYPLPGMEEDSCQISKVIWNQPFIRVQLFNSFGMSSDSIKLYQQDTNTLWDITKIEQKIEIDPAYKEFAQIVEKDMTPLSKAITNEVYVDPKVTLPQEDTISVVKGIQNLFGAQKKEQDGILSTPFQTIQFNTIKGYFRPNTEVRTNTCRNFKGFMKELMVIDPSSEPQQRERRNAVTSNEYKGQTEEQVWAQNHCVIILSETGTGKTMLCHSKETEFANGVISFLNSNVDALTSNCEFLARHLRFERDTIKRFIENTKKSGMARRRRRR